MALNVSSVDEREGALPSYRTEVPTLELQGKDADETMWAFTPSTYMQVKALANDEAPFTGGKPTTYVDGPTNSLVWQLSKVHPHGTYSAAQQTLSIRQSMCSNGHAVQGKQ